MMPSGTQICPTLGRKPSPFVSHSGFVCCGCAINLLLLPKCIRQKSTPDLFKTLSWNLAHFVKPISSSYVSPCSTPSLFHPFLLLQFVWGNISDYYVKNCPQCWQRLGTRAHVYLPPFLPSSLLSDKLPCFLCLCWLHFKTHAPVSTLAMCAAHRAYLGVNRLKSRFQVSLFTCSLQSQSSMLI